MDRGSPSPCIFDSPGPETTLEIAALLGRSIGARGLLIGLKGPLGSGKTVFVKGLAEGLGVDPRLVSSPTFVIAQQYPVPEGPEALHHLDLYRLESEAELESIGLLDLLRPGQVVAVEWLDRFPEALGSERLEVEFLSTEVAAGGMVDTGRRRFRATAFGDEPARVLRDWSERWVRLERETRESKAARDAGSGHGDAMLAIVLVASGLLGLQLAWSGADGHLPGCAALAPVVSGDLLLGDPSADELGPLEVTCADLVDATDRARPPGARLEGMARLLDGGSIDPNTASRRLLENLPGIGPGRAESILRERTRVPFVSTRELERVPGIGPKTREKLEPFLAVDPGADAG